jgi:predicted O-methyltransferase YrrM
VYTEDWTTALEPVWGPVFEQWRYRALRMLEIGCFEGRQTRWMLERCPHAHVTVIDTFEGGDDQGALALANLDLLFARNTAPYRDRVRPLIGRSDGWLPRLIEEGCAGGSFDFIYIDGSHRATDVLFDLVCAWRLLPVGGVLCADDYEWGCEGYAREDLPKYAIDTFVSIHHRQLKILRQPDRQCWMEKLA